MPIKMKSGTQEQEHKAAVKLGLKDQTPDIRDAGLTYKFVDLVSKQQQLSDSKKEIEKQLESINEEICAQQLETGFKSVRADDWKVTIVDSQNSHISKEKLLELGVPASVILKATKITPYTYPLITRLE